MDGPIRRRRRHRTAAGAWRICTTMELELKARGRVRSLNNAVAITVVALSVFMAVSKIKDDNVVQDMQAAKADALDAWNEYQSARIKVRMAEETSLIAALLPPQSTDDGAVKAALANLDSDIAHYDGSSAELAAKARALQASYDAENLHDDQFDLSDACLAIALSLAAVAALTSLWWLLYVSWGFGGFGFVMGLAGFMDWGLHPNLLIHMLT